MPAYNQNEKFYGDDFVGGGISGFFGLWVSTMENPAACTKNLIELSDMNKIFFQNLMFFFMEKVLLSRPNVKYLGKSQFIGMKSIKEATGFSLAGVDFLFLFTCT